MKKVSLSNLTEYQKSLLTRLAYVNVDSRRFHKFNKEQTKITIADLRILLLKPHEPYLGCLHSPRLKKMISNATTTNAELITELIGAGLGDLEVIDLADDKETGFNAICFKDFLGDVGVAYRGTDLKTFSSLATDSLTDLEAFLTNNTEQINQAQALFEQHQNSNGKNFLYGHSLGGFLAECIYLQNYENVANAFVINPLHISSQLLDRQEKVNAFRNSNKFSCFVINGDYISPITSPELFADNVQYVENNKEDDMVVRCHLIEAAKFDEDGSFVRCSREIDAKWISTIVGFINNDKIKGVVTKAFLATKRFGDSVKKKIAKLFEKKDNSSRIETCLIKKKTEFDEYVNPNNYAEGNEERGVQQEQYNKTEQDIQREIVDD